LLTTRGKSALTKIRAALKGAERVVLATDADREGEAIAWHLARELRLKKIERATFQEITPAAVRKAVTKTRALNLPLVEAQRARQVLDRLVGWRTSPLAWKVGGKSAGRVQSVALHLLCAREREIRDFVPRDYWSVWTQYQEGFKAFYKGGSAPQALEDQGEEAPTQTPESSRVYAQEEAQRLVQWAKTHPHVVQKVKREATTKSPPPAFTTSTLQQAASAQLGFAPDKTMDIAKILYEGVNVGKGSQGLITYLRTDSIALAEEFIQAAHAYLQTVAPHQIPAKLTKHKNKADAQEAHEAIRPTHIEYTPDTIRSHLTPDQHKLYDLIWRRALAAVSASARLDKTILTIDNAGVIWEARGMTVAFAGYTEYWNNLEPALALPNLQQGQALTLTQAQADPKKTQPPPRYSEAKLVRSLELSGVGRPATYASTLATLKERAYAQLKGKILTPTELGFQVDGILTDTVPDLLDSSFTAGMETKLDLVAEGKCAWEPWIVGWNESYLVPALRQAPQVSPPGSKAIKTSTSPAKRKRPPKTAPPRQASPSAPIGYCCPVCQARLEEYQYQKEGVPKKMLRCPAAQPRQIDHQEVVYFWSRERWWSPTYGELPPLPS